MEADWVLGIMAYLRMCLMTKAWAYDDTKVESASIYGYLWRNNIQYEIV